MVKKLISLLLAAAFVAAPAISQAKRSRTAQGEYNTMVIAPDDGSPGAEGHISNTVDFKTRPGERFVSLVVEDQQGWPVRVVVAQDKDGDGISDDTLKELCGTTSAPIKFSPGAIVSVAAQETPCDDSSTRPATFGKVTATFTR